MPCHAMLCYAGGWAALGEKQRLLPGPVVDISQTAHAEELTRTIQRCGSIMPCYDVLFYAIECNAVLYRVYASSLYSL